MLTFQQGKMCDQIKFRLLEIAPDNIYGIRRDESKWVIGNIAVEIRGKHLIIGSDKFLLSDGVVELLTQKEPHTYSDNDLSVYKNILLVTSAHKRGFNPNNAINANHSWKYINVISKIFRPRRQKCAKNKQETMIQRAPRNGDVVEHNFYGVDVNELVERFKILHKSNKFDNMAEIRSILRELERLGVIEFYG